MKNLKNYLPILITLAIVSAALASPAQNPQPQTNSAPSSKDSSIHVGNGASPGMQKPARKQGRNTQLDSTQASSVQASPERVNRTAAQVDDIALTNVRASAPAATVENSLIAACSAVADELITSRTLIDALENENASLKERHQTDQQMIDLLSELSETRKVESEVLRSAITAKNEDLAAKDAVIASQDKLIENLKRKQSSPWKRLGDVLMGVGIGTIF